MPYIQPHSISIESALASGGVVLNRGKTVELLINGVFSPIRPSSWVLRLYLPSEYNFNDERHFGYLKHARIYESEASDVVLTTEVDYLAEESALYFYRLPSDLSTFHIKLTLPLPVAVGLMPSLRVSRLEEDKVAVIDENVKDLALEITDVSTSTSSSVTLVSNIAGAPGNMSYDLAFRTPIALSSPFNIAVTDITGDLEYSSDCQISIYSIGTSAYIPLAHSFDDNAISITNSAEDFNSNDDVTLRLTDCYTTPAIAGDYLTDLTVVKDSEPVLSFSYFSRLIPESFAAFGTEFYSNEIDNTTLFRVSFQASVELKDSKTSEMRVYFESAGSTFIDKELGFGDTTSAVPCYIKSGIGFSMSCRLVTDPESYILLADYAALPTDSLVEVYIAGVRVFNGDFDTRLSYLETDERRIVIERLSSSAGVLTQAAALPAYDLRSATDPAVVYTISNRFVGRRFDLSFKLNFDIDVDNNFEILVKLPGYGSGFITGANMGEIVCEINLQEYPCISFSISNWVVVSVPAAAGYHLPEAVVNIMTLRELNWPEYVKEPERLQIDLITTAKLTARRYEYTNLPTPEVLPFASYQLHLSNYSRNKPGVAYTFELKTSSAIREGYSLEITFPIQYNLLAIDPAVQLSFPEFATVPSFYFTTSSVVVSGLPEVEPHKAFNIVLNGVRNPDTDEVLHNWSLILKSSDRLVNYSANVFTFSLDEAEAQGHVILDRMTIFPNNEFLEATYTFLLSFKSNLRPGSQIVVEYPLDYKYLPEDMSCRLSGALRSFSTCINRDRRVFIAIDSEYTGGVVTVQLEGIRNPAAGATGSFNFYALYDGIVIDSSKAIENLAISSSAIIERTPDLIDVVDFYFEPISEAARATYHFAIRTREPLYNGDEIVISFPDVYDMRLGEEPALEPLENLHGDVAMRIENRIIYISNFGTYTPSSDTALRFAVANITNPNSFDAEAGGNIKIGARKNGTNSFKDFADLK